MTIKEIRRNLRYRREKCGFIVHLNEKPHTQSILENKYFEAGPSMLPILILVLVT